MPIDLTSVGSRSGPHRITWSADDCALYALAVGAGAEDPLGADRRFVTDDLDDGQRVLPTFAVIPGFRTSPTGSAVLGRAGTWDPTAPVHGGQRVELHAALPADGSIDLTEEIVSIHDKGTGALVTTRAVATHAHDGTTLYETESSAFIVGEGGFGGDRGSSPPFSPPERAPDTVIRYCTRPDQALLYRLCGDKHRLHTDPTFARAAGFDRPILHGLCTFGFTGRALLEHLCASDASRIRSMSGRFTSSVRPGDALDIRIWSVSPGEAVFQTVLDDGRIAIDAGRCAVSDPDPR